MEEIKQKSKSYILVIDGNVDDRFLLSMFLQRFGYDICTASTTADAIEFMNVAPPVAIVAEAIMGASLVSRIKIDNRFLGVTIILVAAIPNLDLELRTRRGEFAAILSKPLDVEKILGSTLLWKSRLESLLAG
jgi:response regulator RpfG family c-di-GMP phosphodiesterase